jgi:transcriptional regulator with XRE-family HTH domain
MPARHLTREENESLVAHVRALVSELGSQSAVARRLGVQQATISALLAGKAPGGFKLAHAVANARELPVEVVLGHHADLREASGLRDVPAGSVTSADPKAEAARHAGELARNLFVIMSRGRVPGSEELCRLAETYIDTNPLARLAVCVIRSEGAEQLKFAMELASALAPLPGRELMPQHQGAEIPADSGDEMVAENVPAEPLPPLEGDDVPF